MEGIAEIASFHMRPCVSSWTVICIYTRHLQKKHDMTGSLQSYSFVLMIVLPAQYPRIVIHGVPQRTLPL